MTAVELPARLAVKFAEISVDLQRGTGLFLPHGSGLRYSAEDRAVCGRGGTHAVPDPSCTCGFYAARTVPDLLDLLRPSLGQLAGSALLDVELGGLELAGPMGIRAAEQRVLGAGLIRWCSLCAQHAAPRSDPPRLYIRRTVGCELWRVLPLCDDHAASAVDVPGDLSEINFADLSGLLRTETRWAPDDFVDQLVHKHQVRVARGQSRGPLLRHRRVSQLRMGQVGFVSPGALRLGSDGRLWVAATAAAAQRSDGELAVPVLRAVGMWLEVVLTPGLGGRIDAEVSRPRPNTTYCSEMPVDVIQGIRYAPRLAEALGW